MSQRAQALTLVPLALLTLAALFTQSDALMERRARDLARADREAVAEQPFEPVREQVVRVTIRGGAYQPARLEVGEGTTVVWVNEDPVAHTVTAANRTWSSGSMAPGSSFSRRFARAGRFSYFCIPHSGMTGVVVVRSVEEEAN